MLLSKFKNSIENKILMSLIGVSIALAMIIMTISGYMINQMKEESIKQLDVKLREDLDRMVRSEVEIVISLLEGIYQQVQTGEITLEEGKTKAANLVRELRYGKNENGYFWIDQADGTNVVLLGNKEVEGKNRMKEQDAKEKYFIQEIIKNAKNFKGGYTNYWFPKKGQTNPSPKRGYSLYFAPFDWVVGTGIYVDDIDDIVAKENKMMENYKQNSIYMMLFFSGIGLITMAALARFLGKKITYPIMQLTCLIDRTAKFDLVYDKQFEEVLQNTDETGVMAKQVVNMRNELRDIMTSIKAESQRVSTNSADISKNTNEVTLSIEEVAKAVEELANGAMNQSVEAGKGFAVVAEEVRKLAEKTAQSTQEIENITTQIQWEIKKVNQTMDKSEGSIEKVNKGVIQVEYVFDESIKAMEQITEQLGQLIKNIYIVNQEKEDVTNAIQNITAVIQEAWASTDEVSASIEEQTASIIEVAEMGENLKRISKQLEERIDIFKM